MMPPHIAPSEPKYSRLAYAEVQPLIIGEMPFEFILIAHPFIFSTENLSPYFRSLIL
jgi:hypothetical protein